MKSKTFWAEGQGRGSAEDPEDPVRQRGKRTLRLRRADGVGVETVRQ